MENNCVFCKIVNGLLPASYIASNNSCIVIKDIAPKAPVHYLVISKIHISSISALKEKEEYEVVTEMIKMAQAVAAQEQLDSFRLVINNGEKAGQTVFHIHMHLLSGSVVPAMMSGEL